MKKTSQIILDPYKHQNGVNLFLDYYAIKTQSPGLEFLQSILRHFSKLPYENVSKIIKLNRDFLSPEHIRLPEEVFDDHARFHLGGTCFSLTFFYRVFFYNMVFRDIRLLLTCVIDRMCIVLLLYCWTVSNI